MPGVVLRFQTANCAASAQRFDATPKTSSSSRAALTCQKLDVLRAQAPKLAAELDKVVDDFYERFR